jgi:hypothetical protein
MKFLFFWPQVKKKPERRGQDFILCFPFARFCGLFLIGKYSLTFVLRSWFIEQNRNKATQRSNRMSRLPHAPAQTSHQESVLFTTPEEVWFWFIEANQARLDGARYTAARGNVRRPCEPVDILRILDRLYRTRRLMMDHLRVLRFYGVRQMPPEAWRPAEARAATLWFEAMRTLEPVFISKEIMKSRVVSIMEDPIVVPIWARMHREIGDVLR